jgi:hypothetical protein
MILINPNKRPTSLLPTLERLSAATAHWIISTALRHLILCLVGLFLMILWVFHRPRSLTVLMALAIIELVDI